LIAPEQLAYLFDLLERVVSTLWISDVFSLKKGLATNPAVDRPLSTSRKRLRCNSGVNDILEIALNQEQLGDVVSLTPVHVNRVLRQMTDDGLIERHRRRIRIVDFERLRELSKIPPRDMSIEPSWERFVT
jgi:CRP-like cAMP-binding protein